MYERTGDEQIVPITPPLPEADAGAPMPHLLTSGARTVIAYWTPGDNDIYGPVAVVRFEAARAVYFGSPNDEALDGHPLFRAGLRHYEFAEVKSSPWIASLERRNRVHPYHDPERFSALRHFILPFHDDTVECVATAAVGDLVSAPDPWTALLDAMPNE